MTCYVHETDYLTKGKDSGLLPNRPVFEWGFAQELCKSNGLVLLITEMASCRYVRQIREISQL